MLPDILMCMMRRTASFYLMYIVHYLIMAQTCLERSDLLRLYSRPFYWMVAHVLLSDDIINAVGTTYSAFVFSHLAAFLADRRVYMLQFCWHRLTQLLIKTPIRGTARAQLQRAVIMTLRDADVPEPLQFFANLPAGSAELRAWQRFFGGPDVMAALTAGTAESSESARIECMVSANYIYAPGYVDDNDEHCMDMETVIRHMALVGNVNFLTNLPMDRATLERRNPCLVKKMSGDL